MRTRFAPSPTGYLHKGHAVSALCAFGWARQNNAECLLRIEDIDETRTRAHYIEGIYEDLQWLGCEWPEPVRIQSQHHQDYQSFMEKLRKRDLVYRCFKTRADMLAQSANAPHHESAPRAYCSRPLSADEEQEKLTQKLPYAWRLSLQACQQALGARYDALTFVSNGKTHQAKPEMLGDVILGRKDIGVSYHLACTHDDAAQEITHIIRGEDLFISTHIHCLLQALMGWRVPVYYHHALACDEGGERLAKRKGAQSLRDLRLGGASQADMHAQLVDFFELAIFSQ